MLGSPECSGVFEVLDTLFEFPGLSNPDCERHGAAGALRQRWGGRHDGQGVVLAVEEVGIFNPPDNSGHSAPVSDLRDGELPAGWDVWGAA